MSLLVASSIPSGTRMDARKTVVSDGYKHFMQLKTHRQEHLSEAENQAKGLLRLSSEM